MTGASRSDRDGAGVRREADAATVLLVALVVVASVSAAVAVFAAGPVAGGVGAGLAESTDDGTNVSITQSPESATADPGTNVTVEVTLTVTDRNAPAIDLAVPDGWRVVVHEENGSAYYRETAHQWVWVEGGDGETTRRVRYTVRVPSNATGGNRSLLVVGSAIDPETGERETARHVTRVAVEAPTPTPTETGSGDGGGQPGGGSPGEVEITGRSLLNRSVTTGEDVVARVELANYDPAAGRLALRLTADGSVVVERTVTVGASTERTVFLRHGFAESGRYAVALNGAALGTVTVSEPATTDTPTPMPTTVPTTASETPAGTTATPPRTTRPSTTADTTGTTDRPGETTAADGPGFGGFLAGLAASLAVLVLRRDQD